MKTWLEGGRSATIDAETIQAEGGRLNSEYRQILKRWISHGWYRARYESKIRAHRKLVGLTLSGEPRTRAYNPMPANPTAKGREMLRRARLLLRRARAAQKALQTED